MKSLLKKTWISPFVGFSFFIVSITGLLMFMHVRIHAINSLHEWMGLLFVITGVFHLILNWSVFLSYFNKKQGAVALLVVLLFALLFTFSGLSGNRDHSIKSAQRGGHAYHRH